MRSGWCMLRGGREPYTRGMDDAVDALNGFVKDAHFVGVDFVEIADLDEVELAGVLRAGFDHGVALGHRPCCTPDFYPPAEQLVDDMGADEAGGTGDENILSVAG